MSGIEKSTATEIMVKCMEHIFKVSNANLIGNADGLLSKRSVDLPVGWIGKNKVRVQSQKLSCLINFFVRWN